MYTSNNYQQRSQGRCREYCQKCCTGKCSCGCLTGFLLLVLIQFSSYAAMRLFSNKTFCDFEL